MNSNGEDAVQKLPAPENISAALNFIDLSSSDVQNSVSLLREACLDSGFFYIINHGISLEFMDEVFAQSKRFFSLPLKEKMKVLRNEKHRGYTPVLDEHLDPLNQIHVCLHPTPCNPGRSTFFHGYIYVATKCSLSYHLNGLDDEGDYKEGYYIGVEVSQDDPEAEKPFYGPNVWPMADILPGWRETMERYHREALEVGRAVARMIALALNLDGGFFDQPEVLDRPIATLRLLHYEGKISEPTRGIYGAGAHTDFGLLTLLATDDVTGLQICKDKYAHPQIWEYVLPVKGAFVVNLGDMLERWSNCIFRSTLHRVLGNGQERYSIAFFVEPGHDCIVECLPTCQSDDNPPKFPPVQFGAYMVERYMDTHADRSSYK